MRKIKNDIPLDTLVNIRENIYKIRKLWKGKSSNLYFVKIKCDICGGDYLRNKYHHKRYKRAFCSKACQSKGNTGSGSPSFSGGKKLKRGTYGHILIYKPDHPNARKNYVPEHRLVMEAYIGRYLRNDEFIHHIDCDPQNNSIENLFLTDRWQHNAAHSAIEKCVKRLLEVGVLGFDRETASYQVLI